MFSKLKLSPSQKTVLLAVITCSVVVLTLYLIMTEPTKSYEYTGILTSVKYEHLGAHSSVSATIMGFADGWHFRVKGHHVYEIGAVYVVTYTDKGEVIDVHILKYKQTIEED